MMKYIFKLVFDNGKIFYYLAKNRARAIEMYCQEFGVCRDWVDKHCLIKNQGQSNKLRRIDNELSI